MESMSSSGTAASSCSHLDWVLLNTTAVAGRHGNSTTARSSTRNGNTIEVSLCPKQAPHPSILFVNSSDMNLCVPPDIICTVDDLLLLSVNMGSGPFSLSPKDCDYFIYRAHTRCPLLHLLKRPHPYFNDIDVGLLPRSDGEYTVAALIPTTTADQYKLHLFHSKIQSWSCTTLSVNVPQTKFPVKIPRDSDRLLHHLTSTVITIGGKDGTMGWVDLWRGILFCNVLDDKPSLQCLPLPLPLKELSYNEGDGFPFGPAGQRRGIAFIRDKGCLKLVHMEISDVRLRRRDNETGAPSFRTDNWVLTTWSNTRMTNSYEDWHQDYMVQASNIQIDNPAISEVLESGFFMHKPLDGGAAGEQLALHNLSVSQPTPCLLGKDIVYLVARKKYMHPGAWILAVDMENGKLQAVAEFGSQRQLDSSIIYCPSRISKYINPVTTPVVGTAGEGHLMSWDEHINTSCSLDTVNCYGTRIKVIGNTGSNSTRQSVHATEQGFAVGMHAALHINPYYGKTSTAGLMSHFEAVLPMGPTIIYNVPSRSGQDIPPQVIEALSGFPNMAGVKECVGHERVKCYTDKGITIWSGNDDECHDSRWKYGATGVISVTSNLVPGFMHSLMYEGENAILNEKLLPLMEWLFCQPNPIALNTALAQLGVARPVFRFSYVPLPLEKRVEFVRIVDAIGRENFVGQKEARVLDDDDFVLISRY